MQTKLNHETALEILRKYNSEPFHIRHGLTVEGCMEWFAEHLGYGEEKQFWGICGLLHDVDFEQFPEELFFASTFSSKMQIDFLKVAWGISPVLHFLCRHSFRCRRGAVAGIQSLLVTDM